MHSVYANETMHLMPHLRRGMLSGTIQYRDQLNPVSIEKEHDQRLQAAGLRKGFGGQRDLPQDYRIDVIARDTIGRMPNVVRTSSNAEG